VTSVGLRFHPRGTEHKRVISRWIGVRSLRIPPRTKDVLSQSSHTFRRPVNIISFQPHMHCRGQAMTAKAYFPNGDTEILCSVPNYDFNWQTTYTFTEPPYLPAGTRLEVTAKHDNTEGNPNNPNPDSYVRWGQSTFDEMMHGWTDFVYADEAGDRHGATMARRTPTRPARSIETREAARRTVANATRPKPPVAQPQPAPLRQVESPIFTRATEAPAETPSNWPKASPAIVAGAGLVLIGLFVVVSRRFL